jgi:hypothetical protein
MDLKQAILNAPKKLTSVILPEAGGAVVFVKAMTGAEYDVYLAKVQERGKGVTGMRQLIVSSTVCDEAGRLLFTDPAELNGVHTAVLERLTNVALRVNGLTETAQEELEKKV